jgi:membrane protein implicated in regulation of membrane protease activity
MTEKPKRLQWGLPEQPPPARPYRDSAVFYAVLSAVIVLVAWLTGGGIVRAIGIAIVFFVVATAWSFWRWRDRLRRAAAAKADEPSSGEEARS